MSAPERPVALVTGVGRTVGIGAAIAVRLAADGWDVGHAGWRPYDDRLDRGAGAGTTDEISGLLAGEGARSFGIEADLADPESAGILLGRTSSALGPIRALVLAHCESVDSGLLETTLESFDRHFAVNARASWLLIRAFGRAYEGPFGAGRIVALTSDHVVGNLPYGASKGALDRIALAAARELADRGITSNVVDPGPTDTGWMSRELEREVLEATPLHRLGRPEDAAALVSFLCSAEGGWINGQRLRSDGGIAAPG